jgi:hypothetical protein
MFSTMVFLFALAGCGPVTAVPVATASPTLEPAPVVQVQKDQVGPYLVRQDPPQGQRLELSPTIQFTFDRDMDQAKTASAFTFLNGGPRQGHLAGCKDLCLQTRLKAEPLR